MSYIRANEFTLRNETVAYIFRHAPELGYSDEETEEYLAAFDRKFLKLFYNLVCRSFMLKYSVIQGENMVKFQVFVLEEIFQ